MLSVVEILLSAVAAGVSLVGAGFVAGQQTFDFDPSIDVFWPLPGLVFVNWAVLGLLGFLATALLVQAASSRWNRVLWGTSGALVTLGFISAFSIGPFVLLAAVLFLAAALLDSIRKREPVVKIVLALTGGAVVNLVILLLLIFLNRSINPY